jgi:acyl-coenzyme A thioesterase PaaI-like protein
MSQNNESPGEKILANWKKLKDKPFGKVLFSRAVGKMAAYTGTIKALVTDLQPGHCQVFLKQRRGNMNHLRSIHAVALINLGEVTSGLAVLSGMTSQIRGILTKMEMEYIKKAKGDLTAECICEIPEVESDLDYQVQTTIKDASGEVVAVGTFYWLLSRKPD